MSPFCFYALALLVLQVRSYHLEDEVSQKLVRNKRSFACSDYPSTHTMCVTDVGTNQPLTAADKQTILDVHNELRSGVDPPAVDMQKMYWDDELADIAAKWAPQCKMEHDKNENRKAISLPKTSIGQNMAWGYTDWEKTIKGWYSEVKDFTYGTGSTNGGTIGHFTQVVLAGAARVGCAKADCKGKMKYDTAYACNYATGQTAEMKKTPYCTGDSCQQCQEKDGKLCDCKGKVCFNGGTFDASTCSCTCYALYTGDQCETKNCPEQNNDYSSCTDEEKKGNCEFVNWGPQYCKFFCGLCPDECSITCQNGGSVNSEPCLCLCPPGYTGKNCETKDQGQDCSITCENGGTVDSESCTCRCAAGFSGDSCQTEDCSITCENGGTVDSESCTCRCAAGFSGDSCQTEDCSITCENGGTVDSESCTCRCAAGFSGDSCQTEDCSITCENGGTVDSESCTCRCAAGFSGDSCQTEDCSITCENGGTVDSESCTCRCAAGFSGDSCQTEDCSITCENGGTVDSESCTCRCAAGFSGDSCQTEGTEICGGLRCPAGTTLYEPNCHCADNKYDCFEGREHPICVYAWCVVQFWRQFCPHSCGKCGVDCDTITEDKSPYCVYASCSNEDLKQMCPIKCEVC